MRDVYYMIRLPGLGYLRNSFGRLVWTRFRDGDPFETADAAESVARTYRAQNPGKSADVMRVTITMESV